MIPSSSAHLRNAPHSSAPSLAVEGVQASWTADQEVLLERLWRALHHGGAPELEELSDRLHLEHRRRSPPIFHRSAGRVVGQVSSECNLEANGENGFHAAALERADLREIFQHQEWDPHASAVNQLASWLKRSCRWRAVQLAAIVLQEPSSAATQETLISPSSSAILAGPSTSQEPEVHIEPLRAYLGPAGLAGRLRAHREGGLYREAARHLTIEIEDPSFPLPQASQQHPTGAGAPCLQEDRVVPPGRPAGSVIPTGSMRPSRGSIAPSADSPGEGSRARNREPSRVARGHSQPAASEASRPQTLEGLMEFLLDEAERGSDGLRRGLKELGKLLHHSRCSTDDVIGALRCFRDHPELARSVLKLMLAALPSDSPDILVGLWTCATMRLPHSQQRTLLSLLGLQLLAAKPSEALTTQIALWAQQATCPAELLQRLLRGGCWHESWLEVASGEVRREEAVPLIARWLQAGMDLDAALELIASSLAAASAKPTVSEDWIRSLARLLLSLPPSVDRHSLLVRASELLLQDSAAAVRWLGHLELVCQDRALWRDCVQALMEADVPDERVIQALASSDHPFRLELWRAALAAKGDSNLLARSHRLFRSALEMLWPCSHRITEELHRTAKELLRAGLITSQDLVGWVEGLPASKGADMLLFLEGSLMPNWTQQQMLRLSPLVCHSMRWDLVEGLLERRSLWRQWFLSQDPEWTYENVLLRWEQEQVHPDCVSTPIVVSDLLHAMAQLDVSDGGESLARGHWAAVLAMRDDTPGASLLTTARALICILSLLQTVQRAERPTCDLPLAAFWVDQIRQKRVPLEVLRVIEKLLEEIDWSRLDAKTFARLESLIADQMEGIAAETMGEIEYDRESLTAEKLVQLMCDSVWLPFWRLSVIGGPAANKGLQQALLRTQGLEGSFGDSMRSMMVSGIVQHRFWEDPTAPNRFEHGMAAHQILSDHLHDGFVFSPVLIQTLRVTVTWLSGLSEAQRAEALTQVAYWVAKGSFVAHPSQPHLLSVIDSFKGLLHHLWQLPEDSYLAPVDRNLHRKIVTAILSLALSLCPSGYAQLEKRAAIQLLQQLLAGEFGEFYQHVQELRLTLLRLRWDADSKEVMGTADDLGLDVEQTAQTVSAYGGRVVFPIARLALLQSFLELDRREPSDLTKRAVQQMFQHAVVAEARYGSGPEYLWRSLGGSVDQRVMLVAQTLHGIVHQLEPNEQRVSLFSILGEPLLADLPDDQMHLSRIAQACVQAAPDGIIRFGSHLLFWRASLNHISSGSISLAESKTALRLVERLFSLGGHTELATQVGELLARSQLLDLRTLREWGVVRASTRLYGTTSPNAGGGSN